MPQPKLVFEIGLNHIGDVIRARRMIDALRDQGAVYVTLQCLVEPASVFRDVAVVERLRGNCLSLEENLAILGHARASGFEAGAVPLAPQHVAYLVEAGVSFLKILSGDISYEPLISAVASTNLPFYLSTGGASLEEIRRAVGVARAASATADVRLIHTVLRIPTPVEFLNLACIPYLASSLGVPVAYGQHSDVPLAIWIALALGAEAVFLYVAEERVAELPDGPHAVLCQDVRELLESAAQIPTMIGSSTVLSHDKQQIPREFRRSIVAANAIAAGKMLAREDMAFKRPGTGRAPWDIVSLLNQSADRFYQADEDLVCNGFETEPRREDQ